MDRAAHRQALAANAERILLDSRTAPGSRMAAHWERRRRQKRALVVSVPEGGALSRSPGEVFANQVRTLMALPKRSDCFVYDAEGKLIAVIDGVTRQRRAV